MGIMFIMVKWFVRRTWNLKVGSSNPDRCTHVVFYFILQVLSNSFKSPKRFLKITDIAAPAGKRIGEKENEKVEKYQDLKREIARMWNMRNVLWWYQLL